MKWIPNAFRSDVVEFTLLDLLKLALGRELQPVEEKKEPD